MTDCHSPPDAWVAARAEIRDALIRQARLNEPIAYSDLVNRVNALELAPFDQRLFALLGEVSREEADAGRGMLSAFVVHRSGDQEPGPGFFELAEELGRDVTDRLTCWVEEMRLAHEAWRANAVPPRTPTPPPPPARGLLRITDPDELRAAQAALHDTLVRSATRSGQLPLGWKGGGSPESTVHWLSGVGIWFTSRELNNRWWNVFGLGDPFAPGADRSLVLEINPSKSGSRHSAGAFLRDHEGHIHLAHSGRVGGGRPGINREAFVAWCAEHRAELVCTGEGFVLGQLADAQLPARIAAYVRAVDEFKRDVTS